MKAQNHLPAGTAELTDRGPVCPPVAMVWEYPKQFAWTDVGMRMDLVSSLECWDATHEAHLFKTIPGGHHFLLNGLVESNGDVYTLLDAKLTQNYPRPILLLDESSMVLKHERPSWTRMCEVVEMCSGFGGMAQGLSAAGFMPVLAVDFNDKFLELY